MKLHGVLLQALRFDRPRLENLSYLNAAEWRDLLRIADKERLTLALGLHGELALPPDIRARIDANLAQNAERFERSRHVYEEIARALKASDIESVVLKGFSHWPSFSLDPRHRPQYDLDLFCLPDQVLRARDVLLSLGYEPLGGF